MNRRTLLLPLAIWLFFAGCVQASAGPLLVAIPVILGALSAVATGASITSVFLTLALGVGLKYLQDAITGKPKQKPFGIHGTLSTGGDQPRTFMIGYGLTAGLLTYANTWPSPGTGTPNNILTYVIKVSDLPLPLGEDGLLYFYVDDQKCTYDTSGEAIAAGYPVPEFHKDGIDNCWIRYRDGNQTIADFFLVDEFGGDPYYPYTDDMVGRGCAYVIISFRVSPYFAGFPRCKFVLAGAKFYDPRKDDTVGGSGDQRWNDHNTWETTRNPMVIAYNILRGIRWNGQWVYGLQKMTAARLPLSSWFAAMNECDLDVGGVPQYQCGGEIPVNTPIADAIEGLKQSCNGRIAEIGGTYKVRVGPPVASVMDITDASILISEDQNYDPFPSMGETINAIFAKYPEPDTGWSPLKDAPARTDDALETEDGGRQLATDVTYDLVPFGEQVQRLMTSALGEARLFRKHTLTLPPMAWLLEPLDAVSYTSARNGYDAKMFDITGGTDKGNLDVILAIQETDAGAYDWNAETDYIDPDLPPPVPLFAAPNRVTTATPTAATAIRLKNGENSVANRTGDILVCTLPADPFAEPRVRVRDAAVADVTGGGTADGAGTYEFRIYPDDPGIAGFEDGSDYLVIDADGGALDLIFNPDRAIWEVWDAMP